MLRNIITISFRNLLKNKSHTAINLIGLSIGITATLVIFLILKFDFSFDKYHNDAGNIYRLVKEEVTQGDKDFDIGIFGFKFSVEALFGMILKLYFLSFI